MTTSDNKALARELSRRLEAVNTTVRTLRDTLSPSQLTWRPPEGAWSVADVLEHLIRSHDDYLPALLARVSGAPPVVGTPRPWKKSLVGGWLASAMRSERKMPSPRGWRVPETPRDGVAEAFLERQRELYAIISEAERLDWRSLRISSPVSRLVRMNIGDAFEVLTSHAERHARQMERLLDRSDFPGRAPR
jgi:hypothetical protein